MLLGGKFQIYFKLATAISVNDFIAQVSRRCEQTVYMMPWMSCKSDRANLDLVNGTQIPNEAWVRLQFWPKA